MFELETITKAKLIDVVVLSQKNRQPDENPGAKLTVTMDLPSDLLAMFDGALRGFLFAKNTNAKQGALDGMQAEMLTPAGGKVGTMRWGLELTGYELTVDLGLGGKRSNLVIADCTLSGWRLKPADGGSVEVKVNIESSDVSEAAFGKLAKLKSCDIQILLTPPDMVQDDMIDEPTARRGSAGAAAATTH